MFRSTLQVAHLLIANANVQLAKRILWIDVDRGLKSFAGCFDFSLFEQFGAQIVFRHKIGTRYLQSMRPKILRIRPVLHLRMRAECQRESPNRHG